MKSLPSLGKNCILSKEEELTLLKKSCRGDLEARDALVVANQGLVVKITNEHRRYFTTEITFEDLVQEGNLGLIHALKKFKVNKKVRLGTYATYWIRQRIMRFITEKAGPIHVPAKLHYLYYKTMAEIAKNPKYKIPEADLKKLERLGVSLTQHTSIIQLMSLNAGEIGRAESLTHVRNVDLQRRLDAFDVERLIDRVPTLSDREKYIIKMRIGLFGYELAFKEIAEKLGSKTPAIIAEYKRICCKLYPALKKFYMKRLE